MNTTIKDEIRAENVHLSNEINARNLETYHSMLNSFNMQATLIVGFALNSINASSSNRFANDDSRYCIYTSGRAFWGYIFGSSTVACISISLTCIAASFYMTIRSQECSCTLVCARPSRWSAAGRARSSTSTSLA